MKPKQLHLTYIPRYARLGVGTAGYSPSHPSEGVGGSTASRPVQSDGLTSKYIECKLCASYYSNWLKAMSISRMKLLRAIHEGNHPHHDDAAQNRR